MKIFDIKDICFEYTKADLLAILYADSIEKVLLSDCWDWDEPTENKEQDK